MSLVVYRGLQNESGGGLIVARKVVVKIQIFCMSESERTWESSTRSLVIRRE
jgi:hypothetical protein